MSSEVGEFVFSVGPDFPISSEFWSGIIGAIVGAVVGGIISYLVQLKALSEGRAQRRDEQLRVQQALATSLLFKLVRIHSGIYAIHSHFEECYERGKKLGDTTKEPWRFVLALATYPELVHFSSDEMGMLLGLKDNDVFNKVADLDARHNGLVEGTKFISNLRRALGEHLKAEKTEGYDLSGRFTRETYQALVPKLMEIDSLIEHSRPLAKKETEASGIVLTEVNDLFRKRLGLTFTVQRNYVYGPLASQTTQPAE